MNGVCSATAVRLCIKIWLKSKNSPAAAAGSAGVDLFIFQQIIVTEVLYDEKAFYIVCGVCPIKLFKPVRITLGVD